MPESSPRYRERSPLFHAERIQSPVIFFQGEQDRVVPPGQSERIVASLKSRGIPHEFHTYPEADHAFLDYNRDRYHKGSSDIAWPRTLEFFATNLKKVAVR